MARADETVQWPGWMAVFLCQQAGGAWSRLCVPLQRWQQAQQCKRRKQDHSAPSMNMLVSMSCALLSASSRTPVECRLREAFRLSNTACGLVYRSSST